MEGYRIRRIELQDSDAISRIQAAITKSPNRIDFKQVVEKQACNNGNASLVAEVDGQVVGYMISFIVYGGFGVEKSAWIATLGVDPKFMGRGIGKELANRILALYNEMEIQNIFTSVPWDSVDLLSFFKTLGFDRSNFINLRKNLAE